MFILSLAYAYFVYALIVIIPHLSNFIYSRLCNKAVHKKIKNKWILITGATDGIGRSLALEFAKLRYNIIIVGRNKEKLRDVEAEMQKYKAKVITKLYDFNKVCDFTPLHEYEIALLINNAGVCTNGPQFFITDNMEEIVNVNILNTLKITKVILNKMMNNRMGYIVNIGSITGDLRMPLLSTYAASKAMLRAWTESLHIECIGHRVNVECIDTGFVATKMSKIRKTNLFCPSPDEYARNIVNHFGNGSLSFAYWPHLVVYCLLSIIPGFLVGRIAFLHLNKTRQKIMGMKKK